MEQVNNSVKEALFSTTAKKSEKLRIEPVFVSVCQEVNSGDNCPEKTEDRFRIILLKKGSFLSEINGKNIHILSPGVICLNEKDSLKFPCNSKSECQTFFFNPRFLNKNLNFQNIREKGMGVESEVLENRMLIRTFTESEEKGFYRHLSPENFNRICELMENSRNQLENQETGWWPCKTRSFLMELLFLLAQIFETTGKSEEIVRPVSQDFKPILDYINREYSSKITLATLCAEFGTNRTSLNKKFKEETGLSAIAYLINLRLRIAFAMLQDTDLPVSEISERTGFADSTHFERLFKKQYSLLPVDVRKKR